MSSTNFGSILIFASCVVGGTYVYDVIHVLLPCSFNPLITTNHTINHTIIIHITGAVLLLQVYTGTTAELLSDTDSHGLEACSNEG